MRARSGPEGAGLGGQVLLEGVADQSGGGVDVQLLHDAGAVVLHRLRLEAQLLGDLPAVTTWVTASMSMPRAAISVATSTRSSPALKLPSARSRVSLRLVAVDRRRRGCRRCEMPRHPVGAVLGAREHERARDVLVRGARARAARSSCRLLDEVDALIDALDRGRDGVTATLAGSRQQSVGESSRSRFGIVAEKNSVWRLPRERGDHPPDVVDEAHVEHAVGLVEHEHLDRRAGSSPGCRGRAAGPAWRRGCRRRVQRLLLRGCRRRRRSRSCAAAGRGRTSRKLSPIWTASSRVGEHQRRGSRRAGWRRSAASRCRIGSANAAVLPVPVCASPEGRAR